MWPFLCKPPHNTETNDFHKLETTAEAFPLHTVSLLDIMELYKVATKVLFASIPPQENLILSTIMTL